MVETDHDEAKRERRKEDKEKKITRRQGWRIGRLWREEMVETDHVKSQKREKKRI